MQFGKVSQPNATPSRHRIGLGQTVGSMAAMARRAGVDLTLDDTAAGSRAVSIIAPWVRNAFFVETLATMQL